MELHWFVTASGLSSSEDWHAVHHHRSHIALLCQAFCEQCTAYDSIYTVVPVCRVPYLMLSRYLQEKRHDAGRGMSLLVEDWVSRAAALQRKGRAGRVQPGQCFSLFTRQRFEDRMKKYQVITYACKADSMADAGGYDWWQPPCCLPWSGLCSTPSYPIVMD